MSLYDTALGAIRAEYDRGDYPYGYTFLYSAPETLQPSPRVAVVGINPGGRIPEEIASMGGERFRELASPAAGASRFFSAVCALFQQISLQMGRPDQWQSMMDRSLITNFCPFRSPSWPEVTPGASTFSFGLWKRHLQGRIRPRVLITLGSVSSNNFSSIYREIGLRQVRSAHPLQLISACDFLWSTPSGSLRKITLMSLPHPSGPGLWPDQIGECARVTAACLQGVPP